MDASARYSNLAEPLETIRTTVTKPGHTRQRGRAEALQQRFRVADRLDETTIQKLIQDYRDGIPTQKLGHRYGLGKTSVTRLLQERGVRIRTRQRLGDDLLREAVRLYGEGWSTQRVGDYLGFHQATIWAALKKSGVQLRPRRGWQYE